MERYTLPSAPPPPTTVHNTHTVIPWTTEPPHAEDIAETAASWTTPISEPKHHPLLPFFKPEPDYYYYYNNNNNNNNSSSITSTTTSDNNVVVPFVSNSNPTTTTTTHNNNNFLMHQNTNNNMDSFPLESQSHPFFNNYNNNNPFETGFESGFFSTVNLMGLSSATELLFPPPSLELGGGASFDAPLVAQQQPTLFQKRRGTLEIPRLETGKKIKSVGVGVGVVDDVDADDSGLNLYDSDENENENGSGLNNNQNGSGGGGGGDHKGKKKKGLPAKNLMAERRRRKKLNDRLYMLRSVVPKISKMDRASILGDAVDYLKQLLQRINDLHNELESTPPGSLLPPPSASFHPLTPTPPTLPCRVKEDLYPGSLQSPKNQPAKVEVRVREGRAVNIHMFCSRRPGLLLSTMRALDNLGLDVQQAVISCFNGFALDVFRAEQCREGQDVLPEQIKAVLLDSAGFHGMT